MIRVLVVALIALCSFEALAEDGGGLGVGAGDLERLGVTFEPPRAVSAIERVSGPAEVAIPPAQQAIVSATAGGVLSRLLVAEGDFVAAGAPLAEIASAGLLELEREYIEASLAADLAGTQLARDERLYVDGIIAERRVRESQAAEQRAATTLEQTRRQLALASLDAAALARLAETRDLSSTLVVHAPFPGYVVEQMSALGAQIDALDPVYRIADLSTLWLEMHVPQESADGIEPGMRMLADAGNRTVEGRVLQIGRVADSASQTVLIRAAVANDGAALRVGQILNARVLDAAGADRSFAVPTASIVRSDGGTYVFASSGDEIAPLPATVVGEAGTITYINAEIDTGAEVAVAGVAALKSIWLAGDEEE